jgi:outer membrane protein assembly factor BamB
MRASSILPLLALLGPTGVARANDWPQLGGDETRGRGTSESSGPVFAPAWSYALSGGPIIATPVTSDGYVVVAGSMGDVAALDVTSGMRLWSRALGERIGATPAISQGRIAIPSLDGTLQSLRLTDGGTEWKRAFGGQNYASPLVVADPMADGRQTIVLPAGFPQKDVWRLDSATGETVWKTEPKAVADIVYASPAVANGRVMIGMNHGRFQSHNLATGVVDWKLDPGGQVYFSSPLIANGRVYMFPGDAQARLFAANLADGMPVAGFPVAIPDPAPVADGQMIGQGPAISSPMTIGGLIVVQLRRQHSQKLSDGSSQIVLRGYVAAVDPATAEVRWLYPVGSKVVPNLNGIPELNTTSTPVGFVGATGGLVAVVSSVEPRVAILDAATGKELWSAQLSGPGRASPVFSNGMLFVATDAGTLHAFTSTTNRAPAAPTGLAGDGQRLQWAAATDPEGAPLSYLVRLEDESQPGVRQQRETRAGETSADVFLKPSTQYRFAVRSRDPHGALSPWSGLQSFTSGDAPTAAPMVLPPDTINPSPGPGELPPSGGPVWTMPPPAPPSEKVPQGPEAPTVSENPPSFTAAPPAEASTPAAGSTDGPDAPPAGCSLGGRGGSSSAGMLLMFSLVVGVARRRRVRG